MSARYWPTLALTLLFLIVGAWVVVWWGQADVAPQVAETHPPPMPEPVVAPQPVVLKPVAAPTVEVAAERAAPPAEATRVDVPATPAVRVRVPVGFTSRRR